MRDLKSILLATDFRQASDEAADVAVRLASQSGSRLLLLHVLEPVLPWPEAHDVLQEQARQAFDGLAKRMREGGVEVVQLPLEFGSAADVILSKAQEAAVDLIVIGAGELSRFDRYSVGPVATTVIEHSTQPVLAVRPGGPAARFQKILCPVDQSSAAARGLQSAIWLARAFGGQLVVLTVIPEVTLMVAAARTGRWSDEQSRYEIAWRGEFEKLLEEGSLGDVVVTKEVRLGRPHQQIVAAAAEHEADLIIMGATGRTGRARVLVGSTTRRVMEQLPCSLLTVKRQAADV